MELTIAIISLLAAIISAITAIISWRESKSAKKEVEDIKMQLQIGNNKNFHNIKQNSKGNNSSNIIAGGNANIGKSTGDFYDK